VRTDRGGDDGPTTAFESLPAALARHACEAPGGIAIVMPGDACTYAELWRRVEAATDALRRHGVERGDRVGWIGLNDTALVVLLAGAMRIGAIAMPLNYRLAAPELVAIVDHADAKLVVHDDGFAGVAAALGRATLHKRSLDETSTDGRFTPTTAVVDTRADGPALLVYTSGTTGKPKGAVHTAGGLSANARASIAFHELTSSDRVLTALPLFHVGGLCIQTIAALHVGASVLLHPRFDAGAWLDAVERDAPTVSLLVPATMRAVIDHPRWPRARLDGLRMIGAGSSIIPQVLIEAFHARGVPICQIYGATETGPVSIVLARDDAFAHAGAAGKPALGVDIRLVDGEGHDVGDGIVGEVHVRGPNVMLGYWRDPGHPSFVDGWFRTGDLARRDAASFYWIVGRAQELIISGGENIYPAEIENLLVGMPEVAEAAIVGLPDQRWGEVPVAFVVLRPGAGLDAAAIRARLEGRIAHFKQPSRIFFRATLPRNAMGKIEKPLLAQDI
jgi:fatty-acyl-CoA synthase